MKSKAPPVEQFGLRVKHAREFLGITIAELSKRSGITQAAISQIENGKREPMLSSVLALSKGLGMKLSRLIGEHDD